MTSPEEWWADNKGDIDHPFHYTQGNIEVIDFIRDQLTKEEFKGYLRGTLLKYFCRFPHKGKPVEDLQKALWYLHRLLEHVNETKAGDESRGDDAGTPVGGIDPHGDISRPRDKSNDHVDFGRRPYVGKSA